MSHNNVRKLRKVVVPVFSKLGRNVDVIYKNIEGEQKGSPGDGIEFHILIIVVVLRK